MALNNPRSPDYNFSQDSPRSSSIFPCMSSKILIFSVINVSTILGFRSIVVTRFKPVGICITLY